MVKCSQPRILSHMNFRFVCIISFRWFISDFGTVNFFNFFIYFYFSLIPSAGYIWQSKSGKLLFTKNGVIIYICVLNSGLNLLLTLSRNPGVFDVEVHTCMYVYRKWIASFKSGSSFRYTLCFRKTNLGLRWSLLHKLWRPIQTLNGNKRKGGSFTSAPFC